MDPIQSVQELKRKGLLRLREGNGKTLTLMKPEFWQPEFGNNWIYLLFDLFQIRSLCGQFSDVSLDIVEFASKPTIYHSPASKLISAGPMVNGLLKFSLIRDSPWNKLLFQINSPVLVNLESTVDSTQTTDLFFPLYSPETKALYLSAEGDIKILKG